MQGASGAVLATAGKRFLNEANRLADGRVYTQIAGIEQGGVWRTHERGRGAGAVARVTGFDVGLDLGEAAWISTAGQLLVAAGSPDIRAGGNEQFGRGLGADDSADVPAIEHRAAGLGGEGLLAGEKGGAHGRMCGDDAGGGGDIGGHELGRVEQGGIKAVGGGGGGGFIERGLAGAQEGEAGGAVELASVEVRQAVMPGQRLGDGAFAGRGGAVYGDDEGAAGHGGGIARGTACVKMRAGAGDGPKSAGDGKVQACDGY